MKKKILILDYGLGNYNSIIGSLKKFNCQIEINSSKKSIEQAQAIILPGVGTFSLAMKQLKKRGILNLLKKKSSEGKNILGICLGMQLFSKQSDELKLTEGLGIIKGNTKILPFGHHIGWNKVEFHKSSVFSFLNNKDFYFQHQYYVKQNYSKEGGYFNFQGKKFLAYEKKFNTIGVQFHPEKSQEAGLNFFKCFLEQINV